MFSRKRVRTAQDEFDDHDSLHGDVTPSVKRFFTPRMNFYECSDLNMVTATFELPGMKSGDVTIKFLHNKLTISGEFVDHQPQGQRSCATRELPYGKFSRALTVPVGMKPDDFKARMENGLLTLTFPKNPPEETPHCIPIE